MFLSKKHWATLAAGWMLEKSTAGNSEKRAVLAEGEGFEPSIRYNRIPDFESGAFDHSAILPLD